MKVSIVVPVYNVEKYLHQCVESLQQQTFKDIEIILVDDGSTDSSGMLCDSFAEKYDNVKTIHKENQGLGYARNTGLEYVTGDYVTFIDSDDYADIDMVEKLYAAAEQYMADAVIGGFKRVTNSGSVLFQETYDFQVFNGNQVQQELFMRMLGSSPERSDAIRMSVWNALYSMRVIRDSGALFPSERELISEDIIFDSVFFSKASRAVLINSNSYNYRVNEQSLTAKYKADRFEKSLILYNELIRRVKKLNMGELSVQRVQRQFFVNVRGCIRQEKPGVSKKSFIDSVKSVKKICADNSLQNIISDYPINKLGTKQAAFLKLVKHKMGFFLVVMSMKGIF